MIASLPVRGAWIEIDGRPIFKSDMQGSLPVRGAWIEISVNRTVSIGYWSLPVRGAWIEMQNTRYNSLHRSVAPRKGSVD